MRHFASADVAVVCPSYHLGLAGTEAGVDRLDDLLQPQAPRKVLLRGIAALGVDNPVGSQVEHALLGDPRQPGLGLHDGHGVREGLQVAFQRPRVGRLVEPRPEARSIVRRQTGIPDLVGDLEDRLRPDATVEVVVQQHFRCGQDGGRIRPSGSAHESSRWAVSGEYAGRQIATYSAPSGPAEYCTRSPAVVTIDWPATTS